MAYEGAYQDINARVLTGWIEEGWEWGKPIEHAAYERALAGEWEILLTPTKPVPRAWFGRLEGARVLGPASGGAQQMPILTAAGAQCTVLDYTTAQLDAERLVAEREGYRIDIVQADMTRPLPFADASFDLVVNPVSVCYVREVEPIWREVARVLRPGGTFLTGFDLPICFAVDDDECQLVNRIPFDPVANPALLEELEATDSGVQFSHGLEETLGGLLRTGFAICDLYEDTTGTEGNLQDLNIPAFLAVQALKR